MGVGENKKLIELCKNGNLRLDQLFDLLFEEEGWDTETPDTLKMLLDIMGCYAVKKGIGNFYKLVQSFTLSECFGEEES